MGFSRQEYWSRLRFPSPAETHTSPRHCSWLQLVSCWAGVGRTSSSRWRWAPSRGVCRQCWSGGRKPATSWSAWLHRSAWWRIEAGLTWWIGEGDGTPLQYSCLENPMDGGAWWAAGHGVAKSQTRSNFTFTFHFQALEKEMATHSSVLAWRIPGTEEPGGLPSMGSHRVRHDWSDLAEAATWWIGLGAGQGGRKQALGWRWVARQADKQAGCWTDARKGCQNKAVCHFEKI